MNSDGSITVNPGGTIVVSSGGGGTPGIGIQTNDLLYRYTSVQPNPATDKVRVTSSFGLTRIEAYDLRGRLLFETPASGLKADLDVSSWPRGTYLLRISTPAGPTTKKLRPSRNSAAAGCSTLTTGGTTISSAGVCSRCAFTSRMVCQ